MSFQFHKPRTMMRSLLAALIIVALVVPACMTLACLDAPMSSGKAMGQMSVSDCLTAGAAHDALIATDSFSLIVMAVLAFVSLLVATQHFAPASRVRWALASDDALPPSPLDPRGERLLI